MNVMRYETLHSRIRTPYNTKILIFHLLHLKGHFKIGVGWGGEKYLNVHEN